MEKVFLLEYYPEKFQALNSPGFTYILKLKTIWIFGLFTTIKESTYCIPHYGDLSDYTKHWDNVIKKQLPLK